MTNPIAKILVVMTMLIAFLGQAVAYTANHCNMAMSEENMPMDNGSIDHSAMSHASTDHAEMGHASMGHAEMMSMQAMHNMDNMNEGAGNTECCGISCICPDNICHSIHFVNTQSLSLKIDKSHNIIYIHNSVTLNSSLKSLYRPPIFA